MLTALEDVKVQIVGNMFDINQTNFREVLDLVNKVSSTECTLKDIEPIITENTRTIELLIKRLQRIQGTHPFYGNTKDIIACRMLLGLANSLLIEVAV